LNAIRNAQCDATVVPPPPAQCTHCAPGYYASGGALPSSRCEPCEAGRADLDEDAETPCATCDVGEYAAPGSSTCTSCQSQGLFDDDRDPSTPCSDTDICLQYCPAGTQDDDCDEMTACVNCGIGSYAPGGVFGPESRCVSCLSQGQFDDDRDPSTPCSDTDIGMDCPCGFPLCVPGDGGR
jgi:hypothetical protein